MTDDIIPIEEARRRIEEARRRKKAEAGDTDDDSDSTSSTEDKIRSNQRDLLIACADAELWHDADGTGYASFVAGDHVEHHLLRSKGFRDRLRYLFYRATKGAPNAQAMQDAIATLEAMARFEGEEHTPAVRIADHEGNVYLDLADEHWRVIEITPQGWNVAVGSPVRFVRPRGLRPLPVPEVNGALGDLEKFLNVHTEGDLKLVLGWLVMAFNPRGPYPILVLNGEQGSAKSTAARLLRSIVDPSQAPLRSPMRDTLY